MPDDRPVRGGPGARDLQPDGEGAPLQTEDRHGAARGGQHHLAGHLQVRPVCKHTSDKKTLAANQQCKQCLIRPQCTLVQKQLFVYLAKTKTFKGLKIIFSHLQ